MITKQDILQLLSDEGLVKPDSFIVEDKTFIRCFNLVNFDKRFIDINKEDSLDNVKDELIEYYQDVKEHQEVADYDKTLNNCPSTKEVLDLMKKDPVGLLVFENEIHKAMVEFQNKLLKKKDLF